MRRTKARRAASPARAELPGLPERLHAAGRAGFEAAEVAWPYTESPQALASAAQTAGLRLVLINTPRGST